jgi:hypothetical protein
MWYLDVPNRIDTLGGASLPLIATLPTRNNVMFDPDRDGWPGATILRAPDATTPGGQLVWSMPSLTLVRGPAGASVHVATRQLVPVSAVVRAQLLVCDAAGTCAPVAASETTATIGLIAVPLAFDFGDVDVAVPSGGTVRLALDVPNTSADDAIVWVGVRPLPSTLTLTAG